MCETMLSEDIFNECPPLPQIMRAFLENDELRGEPNRLLDDTVLQQLEDNSLKLFLIKMVSTLTSLRNWVRTDEQLGRSINKHVKEEEEELRVKVEQSLITLDIFRNDYIWENLNIGHWKLVACGWRRAYTFLTICKTIFMSALQKPVEEIVKECDIGLLMGEPILDNVLLSFAQDLSSRIIRNRNASTVEGTEAVKDEIVLEDVCLNVQHLESRFEISCLENPSLEQFSDVLKSQSPLLISGGIEHWPARRKWSVEYIRKMAGFRTVPVELGSKYTSDDWTQKLMTIEDFINSYMSSNSRINASEAKSGKVVGYIAQHRLFEQITELEEDIRIPDYCLLGESKQVDINAWFGPGNTISPTHYDPKHNILAQVFGTKLIRLYPPSESPILRPFPATSILFNTSQIDLEDSSVLEKYPDFKNAKYCEFLLSPGMMLYLPPKWWHYVKSLSPSFSISFWFE